jgi:hypothetical protein
MTVRWDSRAVRLAWGVGLCSLGLVAANLVLLALDWKAIDSQTVQSVPYLVQAPIVAILGLLIAIRRPRTSIGWLLLAVGAAEAICVILLFPNGRLLPGPRWRWATRVVGALVALAVAAFCPSEPTSHGASMRPRIA